MLNQTKHCKQCSSLWPVSVLLVVFAVSMHSFDTNVIGGRKDVQMGFVCYRLDKRSINWPLPGS